MSVPKAVLEQAREADELHKQTYSQNDPEPTPDPEGKTPEEGQPQEENPVVLQEPGAAPEAKPKPEESVEYWKQRFQTLKGKYDAEIPRLVAQVRTLERDLEEARSRPQVVERDSSVPKVTRGNDEPLVTAAEKEEYGAEFTDFIQRIAREAALRESQKLSQPEGGSPKPAAPKAQEARPQAGQTVYQVLDQRVPRWREINRDPEFLGWLQHPDPFSGSTRHHLLSQAFQSGDAPRVLAFFAEYARSQGLTQVQPRPVEPQGTPQAPAAPDKLPLETLAGPRQNAPSGAPQVSPQKRVWTGKEVEDFYRKCTTGHYRGREQEKAKIEAQIADALREGRIKP